MNTSLVDTLVEQILNHIGDTLATRLHNVVQQALDDASYDEDTINKEVKKILSEIPKTKTPVSPPSNNASVVRTTTPSRSTDVITDESGQARICEETVKKTGLRCTHKSKNCIHGRYLCGVHSKSANNTQPDSNAKPGARSTTNGKSASSFNSIIGRDVALDDFNIGDDIE